MDVVSPREFAVQMKAEVPDRSVLRNRLLVHVDGGATPVACGKCDVSCYDLLESSICVTIVRCG